jgi:hypothetical protein
MNPFNLFADRDDGRPDLFSDEAEDDRVLLAEAGYREVRKGIWADRDGGEWPEADALRRAKGERR